MSSVCGDKKAGAARRAGLGAAVRRYEEFRQNEVQRFDSLYAIKAADHSAGRNQAMAELLSCLSLMRSLGDIARPQPVLEWSKAQVGAVTGSVEAPAAHCLPCQLWIDNKKPWELLVSPLIDRNRLADTLREDVFGHETILPLAFNLADSLSEKNCLRGALVAACEHVISHTKNTPRRSGVLRRSGDGTILLTVEDRPGAAGAGIDHQAVRDAYSLWQKRAAIAFRTAQGEASEGIQHSGKDYTDDVLYILAKYLESLAHVPPRATDQWMWRFENDLWV